jgi:hypothetical protein
MAEILKFPSRNNKSIVRLKLFSEDEIFVILIAINTYSADDFKYTEHNIEFLDPEIAVLCLENSLKSSFFSDEFKVVAQNILDNVERQ